jgi:hypothetical protein
LHESYGLQTRSTKPIFSGTFEVPTTVQTQYRRFLAYAEYEVGNRDQRALMSSPRTADLHWPSAEASPFTIPHFFAFAELFNSAPCRRRAGAKCSFFSACRQRRWLHRRSSSCCSTASTAPPSTWPCCSRSLSGWAAPRSRRVVTSTATGSLSRRVMRVRHVRAHISRAPHRARTRCSCTRPRPTKDARATASPRAAGGWRPRSGLGPG